MENASKALYMAGATLIAILIISAMVYVFSRAANVGETYQKKEEVLAINAFNARFSYLDSSGIDDDNLELLNKASDVVTALNLAYDVNEKNGFEELNGVGIYVYNKKNHKLILSLNNKNEDSSGSYVKNIKDFTDKILSEDLISNNNNGTKKRYRGIVDYSSLTGKVNKITFELIEIP